MVPVESAIDFETLFNLSPNAYVVLTPGLVLVDMNEAYLKVAGRSREQLVGRHLFEAFPARPGDPGIQRLRTSFDQVLAKRVVSTLALLRYPASQITAEGVVLEDRYWSATHTPILDERGEVQLILQHTMDVTELRSTELECPVSVRPVETASQPKAAPTMAQLYGGIFDNVRAIQETNAELEAERHQLRLLFEQAPGFIAVTQGPAHVAALANRAYYQLIGHREIIGKPARDALPELKGQGFFKLLDRVYATGEPFVGRAMAIAIQQHRGAPLVDKHVDFVYQPIVDADGLVSGIFIQGHDVSETHQLAQEISHQAAHDPLTGLINRREFERRLEGAIDHPKQFNARHSLLYLDLDQFKVVNDTCGHAAGDELLVQVGSLLRRHVRASDTLARLGGDEFAVLLENCAPETAQDIADVLRKCIADIEFSWGRRRFGGSVSIGLMSFGGDGLTMKEVLSTADSACFLAKEKGRNRVHAYHPDDAELAARRYEMDWVSRLRQALVDERLVIFAQRIAPLGEQHDGLDRWEILVRLKEVDGTVVPPMAFIPAAERYGLMPAVDRYIISATLRHCTRLQGEKRSRTVYSINLSGTTLNDNAFLAFMEAQFSDCRIAPQQICFEITETTAVSNLAQTEKLIRKLKALGCKFALDDFGSGMSSFGYLKQLPVDYLKIDGLFVKDILDDPVDCAMVEAIAKVARIMGIQTVAEYAENDAIIARLRSLGVDYAQGYGIHKPEFLTS